IDFIRLKEIVDGYRHRAGLENAEQRRNKFRAILEPQTYPVPGFDAKITSQLLGNQESLMSELAISVFAFTPVQGYPLRVFCDTGRKGINQVHYPTYYGEPDAL